MKNIDSFINLKWRNFHENIPQTFEDLRASQDFCDVTLACDDEGLVEAHRIILASGSIFFQKLLSSGRLGSNPHPLLYLKGVRTTCYQILSNNHSMKKLTNILMNKFVSTNMKITPKTLQRKKI